jgi:hypothetical protein
MGIWLGPNEKCVKSGRIINARLKNPKLSVLGCINSKSLTVYNYDKIIYVIM